MPQRIARPRAIPSVLTADITTPFVSTEGDSASVDRAINSVARNVDALSSPIRAVVGHPTLRDQVGELYLTNGSNWIAHGLGRIPRFMYLVVLDTTPDATSFTWCWIRQTPKDLDARRVNLFAVVTGALAGGGGELGGGNVQPSAGALHVLVRLE